jgi:hypothetical protein
MSIWVDADACPNSIKDTLFRAAIRAEIPLTLVANHAIKVTKSPWIRMIQVQAGYDMADDYIVNNIADGDLIVTADIALAADLIAQGGRVISYRGESYNEQNIRQKLAMRDFMTTMRASGEVSGGASPMGAKEKQAFANALDRYIAQQS